MCRLTSSRSARASSTFCLAFCLPDARASAQYLTSGGTPVLSSLISFFSSLPLMTVVTTDLETLTLPPSQATVHSLPVKVVPKDTEKVPVIPVLVLSVASIVSTGGRCCCNCAVKAERRVTAFSEPRRCRIPAVKCTPPSRRKPPW